MDVRGRATHGAVAECTRRVACRSNGFGHFCQNTNLSGSNLGNRSVARRAKARDGLSQKCLDVGGRVPRLT